ncbi:cob(I)yrinic acid a,c-diamide adenosyltransferase [Denitratisoma sp. DHT3]|uniref:cob(I)yrinic acid a,c-diamide adenosyltransferase n=1 Tax=Denitratisoma sp. DHT3 TaxID=1981880 RepID=UPI001198A8B0|nr:cob(I)yrinic acid a,c-diamide adenosyltransferase [Denitratisoma sp. DHT3]QDX81632.1 cob(I)yrinic acid a,c-diamide adenosyltransferase [Denitratisoma sp. DHT3]
MNESHNEARNQRHSARMQRKKALVDQHIAEAQTERGVLVVNTGNGKGKSSSAFGVVARALGHGMKVAVIQFIKGRSDTGEEAFFRGFPDLVSWHVMGDGFTWDTQDRDKDEARAQEAWNLAARYLADPAYGLVVLDEFTYPLKYGWQPLAPVLETLAARPPLQHVIITGRAAPPDLIAAADTVSEINQVKHSFAAGVKAMPGLEW